MNKEEEYIEKFENMQKEIESLKMQAIEGHSKVSINRKTGGDKDEMEVAALSVENQKLKKMIKVINQIIIFNHFYHFFQRSYKIKVALQVEVIKDLLMMEYL